MSVVIFTEDSLKAEFIELRLAYHTDSAPLFIHTESELAQICTNQESESTVEGYIFDQHTYSHRGVTLLLLSITKPVFVFEEKWNELEQFIKNNFQTKIQNTYCSIPIFKFLHANSFNCDLYLKLNNNKYLQVWKKEDQYPSLLIEKYIHKGVRYLYIKKQNFNDFFDFYFKTMTDYQLVMKDHIEDVIASQVETVDLCYSKLKAFGITKEYINNIQMLTTTILAKVQSNQPLLAKLLKKIVVGKDDLATHSLMIGYMSCHVARHLGWDSEVTYQKLLVASLLHDAHLVNTPKLALIHNVNNTSLLLSKEEKDIILNHPIEMVKRLGNYQALLPDIEMIILQHHECPTGQGFPRKLPHTQIAQISALFIIIEDLVLKILNKEPTLENIQEFKEDLLKKYNKGCFKAPLRMTVELFL